MLCLDDVHWADPASLDLVAALARRPPGRAVLLAVAFRAGQARDALSDAAERLALAPLSHAEAAALCGDTFTAELYELSGGNPFYLEQLARARPHGSVAARLGPGGAGIPGAVAAALAGELDALPDDARRVLEAAAVAGEPFEPDVVADIAGLSDDVTLAALDTLLEPGLVRPTSVPRRFVFRHPVIRHAVYAAAPAAWRLRAHTRAAEALERRGAGPVERAHHVEHAARRGDRVAIDPLATAAERVFEQAPATAARFLESALRLLPADADRIELLQRRAYALLGAGQLEAAHAELATTLQPLPRDAWERRGLLLTSQISIDLWSGRPAGELRRLGVRTWRRGPTAPRDGAGLDALSPREREVAALVLAGKRNADIARELFLSVKTVESHTRNIYAKLGVTSRVELVMRLGDKTGARPASTAAE